MTTLRSLSSSHGGSGRLVRQDAARRRRRKPRFLDARIETLERLIMPSSFMVTSTADSGANTLRAAITSSNGTPGGTNSITFKISTGLQTIALKSALPAITNPVVIDGTSQ